MKAVLILDEMPKSCDECYMCSYDRYNDCDFCQATGDVVDNITKRFEGCPLRYLPKKKKGIPYDCFDYNEGHINGYNTCLEEIEGGEVS